MNIECLFNLISYKIFNCLFVAGLRAYNLMVKIDPEVYIFLIPNIS